VVVIVVVRWVIDGLMWFLRCVENCLRDCYVQLGIRGWRADGEGETGKGLDMRLDYVYDVAVDYS
jgi:hypothetical protein